VYCSDLYRWLSPDPVAGDITNPQSLNRYAYVLNNPTNLIDPLGLQCSVFTGSWEGSGQPFPCGDASTHTSQPAESPTSIAGPTGVAVGSMIGYVSPEMFWGEAAYADRVKRVWDSLYLSARLQQGALTPEEAKAFVSLHPELKLTFGLLASADVWSFKYGELTNSIFELLGWKIEENPLVLAGRLAEGPVNLAAVGTVGIVGTLGGVEAIGLGWEAVGGAPGLVMMGTRLAVGANYAANNWLPPPDPVGFVGYMLYKTGDIFF
jgi:hypothetical protein